MVKPTLIDRVTFETIQQHDNGAATTSKSIRNSKYKRTHKQNNSTFNLLEYLIKPRTVLKHKRKRAVIGTLANQHNKKRGKTRECAKKKYTTLKKTIMRHRQEKNIQYEIHVTEATNRLEALTIQNSCSNKEDKNFSSNIHSRNFRDYCDNISTQRLRQLVDQLLRELDRFQKRAYSINEIKAQAHRRYVVGFREAQNNLNVHKCKLLIIATDCEQCDGIDSTIASIKLQCQTQQVPYAFALRRRQLAYTLYKKASISCVAILDYDGVRELLMELQEELQQAKNEYTLLSPEV